MLRGYEAMSAGECQETVIATLEGNDTASALPAVENGEVYRGGRSRIAFAGVDGRESVRARPR